jgi:hypothetical protein
MKSAALHVRKCEKRTGKGLAKGKNQVLTVFAWHSYIHLPLR